MIVVICTQVVIIIYVLKNFVVFSRANKMTHRGERVLEGREGFRQTL